MDLAIAYCHVVIGTTLAGRSAPNGRGSRCTADSYSACSCLVHQFVHATSIPASGGDEYIFVLRSHYGASLVVNEQLRLRSTAMGDTASAEWSAREYRHYVRRESDEGPGKILVYQSC